MDFDEPMMNHNPASVLYGVHASSDFMTSTSSTTGRVGDVMRFGSVNDDMMILSTSGTAGAGIPPRGFVKPGLPDEKVIDKDFFNSMLFMVF